MNALKGMSFFGDAGSSGPKLCSSFGSTINYSKFAHIINSESPSINDAYYLTSVLSYEAERCKLHGQSMIHYLFIVVKFIIKRLVRLLLRLLVYLIQFLVVPPYIFISWPIIAGLFLFYGFIMPKIKKYWNEITVLVCKVEDVGIDGISFTWPSIIPFVGGDNFQIFPRWFPFADVINAAFGPDLFDCANVGGDNWNDPKHGTCNERFAGEAQYCNGSYATDYTLWDYNTRAGITKNKLCNNKINCPNAPENYMLDGSSISGFTPVISTGVGKGTAPFKYLECCKHPGQAPGCTYLEQAKKSINYSSRYPWGAGPYDGNTNVDATERGYSWPWEDDKVFGPFKPITMYQASERAFIPNTTYIKYGSKHYCIKGPDKLIKLKYAIWIFILLFIIYELYLFFYNVHYGYEMKEAGNDKVVNNVRNYLYNKNIGEPTSENNPKIEDAVKKFEDNIKPLLGKTQEELKSLAEKHTDDLGKDLGTIEKFMHSHKITKNGQKINSNINTDGRLSFTLANIGTTGITGGTTGTTGTTGITGVTGLDDKQTIVFGFIMIITFIVLGIVSVTTIIKKKKDKERVEITNWPI